MRQEQQIDALGEAFEPAAMRLENGRHVPIGGVLTPAGPLRRCQLLELPWEKRRGATRGSDGSMLRIRVRGDAMRDDGIRDGDYLVLDARAASLRDGQTVLADVAGCTVVRRVARGRRGDLRLETTGNALPLLGCGPSARIHGAVVGILRKALHQPRREAPPVEPVRRLRSLQRSLYSVKSTYRTTRHPRLRRALRYEAALLDREMARERERLGPGIEAVRLPPLP